MTRNSVTTRRSWRTIAVVTAALTVLGGSAATVDAKSSKKAPKASATAGTTVELTDGAMFSVADQIGAPALWERGITGDGVNVAVIDTGIAPVDALAAPDKIVAVVDLSGEAHVPEARYLDTNGHGTHMAGIIAGRAADADPANAAANPDRFLGIAPDAGIVSVKVADNTGLTDITQVIAGVDWAVEHADELDIRVINLSYSSGSSLGYEADPLSFAIERAWKAGIVVVVAAGNDGKGERQLASPADNPFVISVAAAQHDGDRKFKVPKWATSGDGVRNPDLAAPGVSVESLRVPESRIDTENPSARIGDDRFLGSGSSQSAAVVSGAVALLLEARPDLTPDQVKALLQSATSKISPASDDYSGAGVLAVDKIIDASVGTSTQTWTAAAGDGSLDDARNGRIVEVDGSPIVGDVTVHGDEWVGASWKGASWTGGSWDGASWSGASWKGASWSGASWSGASWSGASWAGASWSGASWSGASWSGASWSGASWSGASWSGASWSGASWSGASWSGASWSGASWSGASWSGASWSGASWSGASWS